MKQLGTLLRGKEPVQGEALKIYPKFTSAVVIRFVSECMRYEGLVFIDRHLFLHLLGEWLLQNVSEKINFQASSVYVYFLITSNQHKASRKK